LGSFAHKIALGGFFCSLSSDIDIKKSTFRSFDKDFNLNDDDDSFDFSEEDVSEAGGSKKNRVRDRESSVDEVEASQPVAKAYRCENRFCDDWNKTFPNKSRKAKHDK
jgi:hypothetical protein